MKSLLTGNAVLITSRGSSNYTSYCNRILTISIRPERSRFITNIIISTERNAWSRRVAKILMFAMRRACRKIASINLFRNSAWIYPAGKVGARRTVSRTIDTIFTKNIVGATGRRCVAVSVSTRWDTIKWTACRIFRAVTYFITAARRTIRAKPAIPGTILRYISINIYSAYRTSPAVRSAGFTVFTGNIHTLRIAARRPFTQNSQHNPVIINIARIKNHRVILFHAD